MGESVQRSDHEQVETLSTKYLGDIRDNLVKCLQSVQQNAPRAVERLYLGYDLLASIDGRIQGPNGSQGGTKGDNRLASCGDGIYSLKFLCIDVVARLSNQSKLEGGSETIGAIAQSVFEHLGDIASVEHVLCDFSYLHLAISSIPERCYYR